MPIIRLTTRIHAPINRCFDLARSIDLHKISTEHTNEQAIDGRTSGLIEMNESVTWRAKHFGITQQLTTVITELIEPTYFVDEMQKGIFKRFRHEHRFRAIDGTTLMDDVFDYTSPFGLLGRIFDIIVLKRYMTDLLVKRNMIIKEYAETDQWMSVLQNDTNTTS